MALALALLLPGPGAPAHAVEDRHLLYRARFLGLPVGDVAVHLTATDSRYRVDLNGRATGLFWALKGIRVHRAASGRIGADGRLLPDGYRDAWREWEDRGDTRVTYDRSGDVPGGIPRGVKNGQPVRRMPDAVRAGALDPLSAIQTVRLRVAMAAAAGDTSPQQMVLPVYDGKLRYDVRVTLGAPERVEAAGRPWRARVATVTFEPRGGFSDKHAAEWRGGGLRLSIADHVKAIPLRFDLDQGWGAFDLVYVGPCGAVATPCPVNAVDEADDPAKVAGE